MGSIQVELAYGYLDLRVEFDCDLEPHITWMWDASAQVALDPRAESQAERDKMHGWLRDWARMNLLPG